MSEDPKEAPITFVLERGKSRSYPQFADYIIYQTIVVRTLSGAPGANDAGHTIFACRAADIDLWVEMAGFQNSALTGETPDQIRATPEPKSPEPAGTPVLGVKNVSARLMAANFALFAEAACDWVKRNKTSDIHNWPPTINFARVVRNAIVHGGKINIQSPTAPVVSWRGLTFSHLDYGREVMHTGLMSSGDLLVLMIEMELELNALGAPFDLG